MIDFIKLEERIGIHFNDRTLLKEAFTHKTYSRENNTPSYERLEFLGDSLLNFLVGDYLFSNSDEEEGALTKERAAMVCEAALKKAADDLGLPEFLLKGKELKKDAKFNVPGDDLYEALLGAVYLDQGMSAAKSFVEKTLLTGGPEEAKDYKSRLQEMVQKEHHSNGVDYRCVEIDAQAVGDEDRFEATVYILGRPVASGRGRNKKTAQSRAAAQAIRKLEHGEA